MKDYQEETLKLTEAVLSKIRNQGLFSDKIEIEWKPERVTNDGDNKCDSSELMITILIPKVTIGQLSTQVAYIPDTEDVGVLRFINKMTIKDVKENVKFFDPQTCLGPNKGKLITQIYHRTTLWMMLYDNGEIQELTCGDLLRIQMA